MIYGFNLIALGLTMGIQESVTALEAWKRHELAKEQLRKENIQGQFQSLKAQVSPHFLFNSLNSLSMLISEEPRKAEEFVAEMGRVYRYLLQTNQSAEDTADELTSLENELSFIASYYHLLKTRHGEGVHLHIHIDKKDLKHRLPPLTLQLLVENAVKHNRVRVHQPLRIDIMLTPDGLLQVRNNVQKKAISAQLEQTQSTKVGLANIRTKYELLAQLYPNLPAPRIEETSTHFTVIIPLVQSHLSY